MKFSFTEHLVEIENAVDKAIAESEYIVTEAELKYFLGIFRLVKDSCHHLNEAYEIKDFSPKVEFGFTYEKYITLLKSKNFYFENDKRFTNLLKFHGDLVSGSVIHKRYQELEIVEKGKKAKKSKPTRKQRTFPTKIPKLVKNAYQTKRDILFRKLNIARKAIAKLKSKEESKTILSEEEDEIDDNNTEA